MDQNKKYNILLICNYIPNSANTILNHIESFKKYSKNNFFVLNNIPTLPKELDINKFDAIVLHYSITISHNSYLCPISRERIKKFKGLKIVFIQDDYRWVNRTSYTLNYLGVDILFGLAAPEYALQMYPSEKFRKKLRLETVLAGYVPEDLQNFVPKSYKDRQIDVGYRARKLPAWLGKHAQEKWIIADKFLKDASQYKLKCDISCEESDRIYGKAWIDFLSNCKAVLGTECGASVCDFTGEIQKNVEEHLLRNPKATFEELSNLYFKDVDGKIYVSGISPRIFEQAALRTLMVLYEGDYSGVIKPWRHYVPLERNHGNMPEIIKFLRDEQRVQEITDCAYKEIVLNSSYSYKKMIEQFDVVINQEILPSHLSNLGPYNEEDFRRDSKNTLNVTQKIKIPIFSRSNLQKFIQIISLKTYHFVFSKLLKFFPNSFKICLLNIAKSFRRKLFRKNVWIDETKPIDE